MTNSLDELIFGLLFLIVILVLLWKQDKKFKTFEERDFLSRSLSFSSYGITVIGIIFIILGIIDKIT